MLCLPIEKTLHLSKVHAIITQFWEDLSNLINKRCLHAHKFRFEEKYVLFCLHEKIHTDKTCDLIALNAKLYIYKCKVQHTELNINIFISFIP